MRAGFSVLGDKAVKLSKIIKIFIVASISTIAVGNLAAKDNNDRHGSQARYSEIWISQDLSLELYGSDAKGGHLVCPRIAKSARQPFCRGFPSPVRGACGTVDKVYIFLADGTIHLVNNALIGQGGSFEPIFHPAEALHLDGIWMPEPGCDPDSGSPDVFAIGRGGVLRFDGSAWTVLDI
jgi:hypothetical protein